MRISDTLRPHQFAIGDLVFGKYTPYQVENIDIQSYNVNAMDFQVNRSDEVRMGIDTLQAGPIVFTLNVLLNKQHENVAALTGGRIPAGIKAEHDALLTRLQTEWKADDVRSSWGEMKPIYFCDGNGKTKRIYGRPRKFQYSARRQNSQIQKVQAEFQRADTLAHDNVETYVELHKNANPVYVGRAGGDAPCWMRILLYGPIEHPTITIGNEQIELDEAIAADTVVEISSYPWMRRAINSDNENLRAKLIGKTQYLDQMRLPVGAYVPMRWSDQANATWTSIPGSGWTDRYTYLDLFKIGKYFTSINGGRAMLGSGLASGGYLTAPFGTAAVLDNRHQYKTAAQSISCRIANLEDGRSGMVFKSNDDMTNYVLVEAETSVLGTDYLRIWTGNGVSRPPTNTQMSGLTKRAEYAVPNGLRLHDTFGAWFNTANSTYTLLRNGQSVATWADGGGTISAENRRQGFVLNTMNGTLKPGPGLDNVVAYDISVTQPDQGRCLVLWRDAYNVV